MVVVMVVVSIVVLHLHKYIGYIHNVDITKLN